MARPLLAGLMGGLLLGGFVERYVVAPQQSMLMVDQQQLQQPEQIIAPLVPPYHSKEAAIDTCDCPAREKKAEAEPIDGGDRIATMLAKEREHSQTIGALQWNLTLCMERIDAITVTAAALDTEGDNFDANAEAAVERAVLADVASMMGRGLVANATAALEDGTRSAPRSPSLPLALGLVHHHLGRFHQAHLACTRALATAKAPTEGSFSRALGDLSDGLTAARSEACVGRALFALGADPAGAAAAFKRATGLFQAHAPPTEAQGCFGTFGGSEGVDAWGDWGAALAAAGDAAMAVDALLPAANAAYRCTTRSDKGGSSGSSGVDLHRAARVHFNLGLALGADGRSAEAAKTLKAALEILLRSTEAPETNASAASEAARRGGGSGLVAALLLRDSGGDRSITPATVTLALGVAFAKNGETERAVAATRDALRLAGEHSAEGVRANLNLGLLMHGRGEAARTAGVEWQADLRAAAGAFEAAARHGTEETAVAAGVVGAALTHRVRVLRFGRY